MPASAYRFGPFVLDRGEYRLRRDAAGVDLTPKAIDLLLRLVDRPGVLFTKEELFQVIWPDVVVTDNALNQVVSEIRQALGDSPTKPTYLQTVARRGYRFIGSVEAVGPATGDVQGGGGTHAAGSIDSAAVPDKPALAVLDFANVTGDTGLAWLSAGIAETVLGDLSALGCFRIVDRERVRWAAQPHAAPLEIARDLRAGLVVTGSFQRAGDRLRIAARLVEPGTGEVRAEAKADGRLEDVFQVQDTIGRQLAEGLGMAVPGATSRARQTSNLEAYRAAVEGRLLLESLDAEAVPAAVSRFLRAIELDPGFAPAYVGLASARWQLFERARTSPDRPVDALDQALEDARRGVELDVRYAEAHGTLAFVLTSAGRRDEARRAARTAVALEPGHWMHHFRLGYASWGAERLEALTRALDLYPDFPLAHFQIAMVHVARGALVMAASALAEGLSVQRQHPGSATRFPAHGLHWLLGMIALARGDAARALEAFESERSTAGPHVYGSEFALAARANRGFALLKLNRTAEAAEAFEACLDEDRTGRAALGLAGVRSQMGDKGAASKALALASRIEDALRAGDRAMDAQWLTAAAHAVHGERTAAPGLLERTLAEALPGPFGWLLPIDPLFARLRDAPRFRAVLDTLAARAG